MIYFIYHILGIKIGCTNQLEKRMSDQGFTEWEILEEHTDIYEASDREIQLQKDYGLPVDKVLYWQALENRRAGSSLGGRSSYINGTSELRKEVYLRQGKAMGLANRGKPKNHKRITCPYCNKTGGSNIMPRYHFDNCKHKKTLTN
jgi:hypothetical protein|tara:strand:+ start:94 stop:531 length:438 start_codon:yes stop_codon:yes gene_type:complete